MGYSEQTDYFPQLSLYGIPSTEEQIWNGLTVGTPWQGVSWQQAEMEHNDAQTSGGTIPYETIPSRSELLGTDDYYAAQDETQVSTPLIQSHEYNTYGHRDGRSWVWWDENGNRHSRPIPEYITADTRTDWQRERDQKEFERRAAAEQQAKNKEEAAVAARALFGLALPSTYIGPLFNNNGESYLYNVVTQQGSGNEAGDFVIDLGTPFGYGALAKGGRYALNLGTNAFTKGIGRTSWRPALRLETQPLRIGTQPLSTKSQVRLIPEDSEAVKILDNLMTVPIDFESQGTVLHGRPLYSGSNAHELELALDNALMDEYGRISPFILFNDTKNFGMFNTMYRRLNPRQRHIVHTTPITTSKNIYTLQEQYDPQHLIKLPSEPSSNNYTSYPSLGISGTEFIKGNPQTTTVYGIIELDPYQRLVTSPSMKLNAGQVLSHEEAHAILQNLHKELRNMNAADTAKKLGLPSLDDCLNSPSMSHMSPEEIKEKYEYFLNDGGTEMITRGSELKNVIDEYDYSSAVKGHFRSPEQIKNAMRTSQSNGYDNDYEFLTNLINLGSKNAWQNVTDWLNYYSPALVPIGLGGAGIFNDMNTDKDIEDGFDIL